MSAKPRTLGYKKPSRCKFCNDWILWQKIGKRSTPMAVSFDENGSAHPSGMHDCKSKPYGIRTAGDIDTEVRQLWREKYVGTANSVGIEDWDTTRKALAKALIAPGAPFQNWKFWEDVATLFTGADRNAYGVIHQVGVQRCVLNLIHMAVHAEIVPIAELKPVQIMGVYFIPCE